MESEVRQLLIEQLKDAYSAEKQALRCMQKTLKMASAPALRDGIQLHIVNRAGFAGGCLV